MAREVEAENEEYRVLTHPASPEKMDEIAKQPGFLRFQFQHAGGQWKNEFPLVRTPRQLQHIQQEPPITRAVFKAAP